MKVGIREKKSAVLKVHILQSTLELLGKKSLKELYVDEICEKVKISKVTFFKYFPLKEDLLLYYYRVWCLENVIKIGTTKKEGLDIVKVAELISKGSSCPATQLVIGIELEDS